MKPSTAKNVAYNLRASKQAERRILIDFLKCANEAGVTISDCRYVGMGGTQFYERDFRAYKELIRFLPRYYESII